MVWDPFEHRGLRIRKHPLGTPEPEIPARRGNETTRPVGDAGPSPAPAGVVRAPLPGSQSI